MRRLLALAALLAAFFAAPARAQDAPPRPDGERPNVVFIIADDLNDMVAGFGGYEGAGDLTPNLRRLMARGVAFTNAHSNNAICSPSRASLLTGLYPHTTGFYAQQRAFREAPVLDRAVTVVEHFQSNGYDVYGTGKIFHGSHQPRAWINADGTNGWFEGGHDFGPWPWKSGEWNNPHPGMDPHYARDGFQNFMPLSAVPDSGGYEGWHRWDGTPFRYDGPADRDPMPDELNARHAVEVLQRTHERPFFLAVGFVRPHEPLYVPEEYFARFPLEELELPAYFAGDTSDVAYPLLDNYLNPGYQLSTFIERFRRLREAYGAEIGPLRYLQGYLASIAFLDDQLGKVLDALEASPHAENTLVVFTSDHGFHIGQKSRLFKHSLWEPATRVPLVVAGPGVAEEATVAHPVSLIDLYPTMADYAGLPSDPNAEGNGVALDGYSLRPFLEDSGGGAWDGPDVALSVVQGSRPEVAYQPGAPEDQHFAVRSERYRYVLTSTGEEELYDHRHDPSEWTNLAGDLAYADVQARLRATLLQMTGRADETAAADTSRRQPPRIVTGPHPDEGPADRYPIPYEPITYGQRVKAPLPGLDRQYRMTDWDQDGDVDLIVSPRRGWGLTFRENVGTPEAPLFRSLHDNPILLRADSVGKYTFDLIDLNKDEQMEVVMLVDEEGSDERHLSVFFNEGTPTNPEWRTVRVRRPDGTLFREQPEGVGDLDGDGRADFVRKTYDPDRLAPDKPETGASRHFGFPDDQRATYRPYVSELRWARNLTTDPERPVFGAWQLLSADGDPLDSLYVGGSSTAVHDINGDGHGDLLVGTGKPGLHVFLSTGTPDTLSFTDAGLLRDEAGAPIKTAMAVRALPGDLIKGGPAELVTSAYFGNQSRYVLYEQEGAPGPAGWKRQGYLQIQAEPDTPVYGMGNSTVDPVDFDGDGDTDLVLGAEPSFPTWAENVGTEAERVFAPAERLKLVDGSPIETYAIEEGVGSVWGPFEWYSDRLAPRARDWDGDGVLDLITGAMGRRLYFFKGREVEGELRFERPQNFRLDGEELTAPDRLFPAVLDWTGDGQLDLLVSTLPGHVVVYPGDGSLDLGAPIRLGHPDGTPIVLEDYWERKKGNRSGFDVADWDGDGQRDLVIYQFHRGVFLFRNQGEDTFGREELLVPLYSHLAGPAVMDWDRDGVLDLVIGGDERRMIEPSVPAHLVVFHGEDVLIPPGQTQRLP